eukprot:7377557-Prymnesium_polylepis.1
MSGSILPRALAERLSCSRLAAPSAHTRSDELSHRWSNATTLGRCCWCSALRMRSARLSAVAFVRNAVECCRAAAAPSGMTLPCATDGATIVL